MSDFKEKGFNEEEQTLKKKKTKDLKTRGNA